MPSRDPAAAADGYETWLTEKLWELVPAYIRAEDTLAGVAGEGALRHLVEIVGESAAEVRRSQDRLWSDAFVELADPWAVPYIGDLVGTRLVQALLGRAQRIDVAKTVYYRRRSGTLRVLEEQIRDITGHDGVIREMFRRLGRTPHGMDPVFPAGPLSGTPAHGLANLRTQSATELAHGPFDELHHTPDVRRPRGRDGWHAINRLAVHLFRLGSWQILDAEPRRLGTDADGLWTFDPSGRDTWLFARGVRDDGYDYDAWRTASEAELPVPIRCRLLGHATYLLDDEALGGVLEDFGGAPPAELTAFLGRIGGVEIESDARLEVTARAAGVSYAVASLREHALTDGSGRAILLDPLRPSLGIVPAGAAIPRHEIGAGRVDPGEMPPAPFTARVDPERGRFALSTTFGDPSELTGIVVAHHLGSLGFVGAGPWPRSRMPWVERPELPTITLGGGGAVTLVAGHQTVLVDCRTYPLDGPDVAFDRLALRAGDQVRPYVPIDGALELRGGATVDAVLWLDGVWLASADPGSPAEVVLTGRFARVEIRGCTLDPGGVDALGHPIAPVTLRVEGFVELLVVQSSVLARVEVDGGVVRTVCVADSVLDAQALDAGEADPLGALAVDEADVKLYRVTALGPLQVHRLWCTDSIVAGPADVFDTQNGCFRFSATHEDSRDHVPHPYESVFFADASPLFRSWTFGSHDYARLSEAPVRLRPTDPDDAETEASIRSGAEDDGEMGAYHDRYGPLRRRALDRKHEEHTPVGQLRFTVLET